VTPSAPLRFPKFPTPDFTLNSSWELTLDGMLLQQLTIALNRDPIEPVSLASDWRDGLKAIDTDYGIILNGRAPVWLHVALNRQLAACPLVANYDPRWNGAIVTRCADSEFRPGRVLTLQPPQGSDRSPLAPAIAIVGPPDSGKSVFAYQLHRTLLDRGKQNNFLQRSHWDGEGNFINELPDRADPERYKAEHKRGLTARFFPHQADDIARLRQTQDIVLVDLGGMIQPEKQPLLDVCTHYIIVSSNRKKSADWHNFCQGAGLQPIAELFTVLETVETCHDRDPYLCYTSGIWETGEPPPIPSALLERLLALEPLPAVSSIATVDRSPIPMTATSSPTAPIALQLIPHSTRDGLAYQHLRIRLTSPDGLVEPGDLVGLALPDRLDPSQGVVLEGRAPIWLYAYLVHECHATAWVGCFDPRCQGAIVVEAHTRQARVGSVLPIELPPNP